MRGEHGTIHDHHRRRLCVPAAADQHLDSAAAVKAWFGIPNSGPDWSVATRSGRLRVHIADENWNPDTRSLTSDVDVDGIGFHAFLTVRSIVHSIDPTLVIPGNAIWVHGALTPHHHAALTRRRIADLVERGLDHLTAELDCQPATDSP